MMSTDSDVGSFVSQPIHPNTPNPYNILSGPSTSTSPNTSAEPVSTEPRICSVRGCTLPLAPGAINKMCEACRGRHRIYASTKRARRKMEKAAVAGIRRLGEQLDDENSRVWTVISPVPGAAVTWDEAAIDPRLYTESPSSNVTRLSVYQNTTYPTGSSSELAGALTLPASTAGISLNTSSVVHSPRPNVDNSVSHHDRNGDEDGGDSESESDDEEEHEVSTTLQPTSPGEGSTAEDTGQTISDTGLSRFCSVKGCKLVIPSNYTFKMCPSCRTRYRTYGNTKRAKWKAEREVFDRELVGLRSKEDERRRQTGERSLSESPEDLRAWELSIIDEQVPTPHSSVSVPVIGGASENLDTSGTPNPDATANMKHELFVDGGSTDLAATRKATLPPSAALSQPVNIDTPQSASPYPHSKNPVLMNTLPLPSRMCTVSHCHKILPGFYRYKRCEQHRLQNRHHSKLKRVREKVIKAIGPNGEELEIMDTESEENEKSEKENQTGKQQEKKAKVEGANTEIGHDPKDGDKPRKRNFTCASDECHNLLGPAVRWRHCEICRARERVIKKEKRELESEEKKEKEEGERKTQNEVERLRDIVRRMAAGEKVDEAILAPEVRTSGSGQEQQHDKGRGESTIMLVEPEIVSNTAQRVDNSRTTTTLIATTPTSTPSVVPTASTSSSYIRPPAPKESPETFQSVFRATPVPFMFTPISNTNAPSDRAAPPPNFAVPGGRANNNPMNTSGSANPPSSSSSGGKSVMFAATDTPLTFRAYKPKTTTSAVGRLLAHNSELSVQVFKDLLLPGKEKQVNTGLVGDSSYHVYKSTPAPPKEHVAFVPTIPTTPPFVYQPTQKKQQSYYINNGTEVTPKASARTVQESNPITGDNRTDIGTSSFKPPNVPNTVNSGSAPATTTPQSSTTPAPVSDTEPPSSVIPRKRASRKPKPTPPPLPPPPPPPSLPSTSSHYPYAPPPQYPYPYYMPSPYSMSSYGPHTNPSISSTTHPPPPPPIASPSAYSPYVTYPYPYAPYGYPSTHPPPPGYPYLPPRYMPSPYVPSAPVSGQPYIPQLQPGTYPPPYGYSKDTSFLYYQHPPETSTAEASSSRKKKRKREDGEAPEAGRGSHPPPANDPPSVVQQSIPVPSPPATPLVNNDVTVGHSAQDSGEGTVMTETKQKSEVISAGAAQVRPCGNKTCNRTIPIGTAGTMCEKCRIRLKKRQTKAKLRFKLEPRKSVLNVREGKKEDDDTSNTVPATPEVEI